MGAARKFMGAARTDFAQHDPAEARALLTMGGTANIKICKWPAPNMIRYGMQDGSPGIPGEFSSFSASLGRLINSQDLSLTVTCHQSNSERFWDLSFTFDLMREISPGQWATIQNVVWICDNPLEAVGAAEMTSGSLPVTPVIVDEFEATTAIKITPTRDVHVGEPENRR